MKVNKEQKRLKAIKEKYVFFPKKCNCCGENYTREKMWKVKRYGILNYIDTYYYCKKCMPSAQDVLTEIDTDAILYGISGVDSRYSFKKKDYTRVHNARKNAFNNTL